jgi:hypothetical protein
MTTATVSTSVVSVATPLTITLFGNAQRSVRRLGAVLDLRQPRRGEEGGYGDRADRGEEAVHIDRRFPAQLAVLDDRR